MTGRSGLATGTALIAYCVWAVLLILPNPGLGYDEALSVLGAVQMRHSPKEIALAHDPDTWVCVRQRCFPLMTARYVGAIKEYACVPVFAAFGPSAQAVRLVSAFFGLIGIWGLARLLAFGVNPAAGAIAAWVLAINPAYLDFTVFDNGTVSVWMGVFGAMCAAIAHYLQRRTAWAAFAVGTCAGLGVWARANFLWLVLALLLACILTWRARLLRPVTHWFAWLLGGLLGGAPFLAYQAISRGGTWQAVDMFSSARGAFYLRWVAFCETLLSDREHRAMWNGPMLPDWQRWLFPAVLAAACLICIALRKQWPAAGVLTLFLLASAFFFPGSRLPSII